MVFNIGGSVTRTSATQEHALGTIFCEQPTGSDKDKGPRFWRYIQTEDALVTGEVVERKAATATCIGDEGAATTTRARCLGVAQHAIADNYYGWILAKGVGQILCDGSVSANTPVVPAASGKATDFSDGEEERVIGLALATDAGPSTLVACDIQCL